MFKIKRKRRSSSASKLTTDMSFRKAVLLPHYDNKLTTPSSLPPLSTPNFSKGTTNRSIKKNRKKESAITKRLEMA